MNPYVRPRAGLVYVGGGFPKLSVPYHDRSSLCGKHTPGSSRSPRGMWGTRMNDARFLPFACTCE